MKNNSDSDLLPDTATLVEVIAKVNIIVEQLFPPPPPHTEE